MLDPGGDSPKKILKGHSNLGNEIFYSFNQSKFNRHSHKFQFSSDKKIRTMSERVFLNKPKTAGGYSMKRSFLNSQGRATHNPISEFMNHEDNKILIHHEERAKKTSKKKKNPFHSESSVKDARNIQMKNQVMEKLRVEFNRISDFSKANSQISSKLSLKNEFFQQHQGHKRVQTICSLPHKPKSQNSKKSFQKFKTHDPLEVQKMQDKYLLQAKENFKKHAQKLLLKEKLTRSKKKIRKEKKKSRFCEEGDVFEEERLTNDLSKRKTPFKTYADLCEIPDKILENNGESESLSSLSKAENMQSTLNNMDYEGKRKAGTRIQSKTRLEILPLEIFLNGDFAPDLENQISPPKQMRSTSINITTSANNFNQVHSEARNPQSSNTKTRNQLEEKESGLGMRHFSDVIYNSRSAKYTGNKKLGEGSRNLLSSHRFVQSERVSHPARFNHKEKEINPFNLPASFRTLHSQSRSPSPSLPRLNMKLKQWQRRKIKKLELLLNSCKNFERDSAKGKRMIALNESGIQRIFENTEKIKDLLERKDVGEGIKKRLKNFGPGKYYSVLNEKKEAIIKGVGGGDGLQKLLVEETQEYQKNHGKQLIGYDAMISRFTRQQQRRQAKLKHSKGAIYLNYIDKVIAKAFSKE